MLGQTSKLELVEIVVPLRALLRVFVGSRVYPAGASELELSDVAVVVCLEHKSERPHIHPLPKLDLVWGLGGPRQLHLREHQGLHC